jgi:hypothetical protein
MVVGQRMRLRKALQKVVKVEIVSSSPSQLILFFASLLLCDFAGNYRLPTAAFDGTRYIPAKSQRKN